MFFVHIIRGLPGSGKSTLAQKLADNVGVDHFEADMYFMVGDEYRFDPSKQNDAHKWCQESAKKSLSKGRSVVVSNTFTRVWEMQYYIDLAKEYKAALYITEAKNDFGNVHNVPKNIIENMRSRWEQI